MAIDPEWYAKEVCDGRAQLFCSMWFDLQDPEVAFLLIQTLKRERRAGRVLVAADLALFGAFEAGRLAGRTEVLDELDTKPWWRLLLERVAARLRPSEEGEEDEEVSGG